jgi:hypothetical protein
MRKIIVQSFIRPSTNWQKSFSHFWAIRANLFKYCAAHLLNGKGLTPRNTSQYHRRTP